MNISAWSIRNPIPPIVLFLVLMVMGILSFSRLDVNSTPNIDMPTVTVTVAQPGAAPSELENQVARKVEDAVAGLGNIDVITSTLTDGASITTVQFVLGTNTDRAVNDVRNAVEKIRQDLPQDARAPEVSRVDFAGGAVVVYALTAPSMNAVELSWFIDNELAKEFLSIKGVSKVQRSGGASRQVRVNLAPERLMALGITAGDVNSQIRALNINLPGGRGQLGNREQSIRTLGSADTIEGLADTEIILPNGRTARLRELGDVVDGIAERTQLARLNGEEVITFSVLRTTGSSDVSVVQGVDQRVDELRRRFPQIDFQRVSSTSAFVEESYAAAIEALWLGALLAVAVVYWFLRDWRATVIAGLAMPLSLVPAFAVMQWFGFTLNNVTLLALSLVVGILVDDAIVEIENIVRHIRMGKAPFDAALEAADEIGLAVVATTMTMVAVFMPVSFMGGIAGQFFKQFGITVAAAVLFSLLVARLITPLMAAYFQRPHLIEHSDKKATLLKRLYIKLLQWSLDHRKTTAFLGLAIFAGSIAIVPLLPSGFIPASDRSVTDLEIELPPGATIEDTDQAALQVANLFQSRPEVISVYTAIGVAQSGRGADSGSAGDVRKAALTVNLKPRGERQLTQQQFEREMSELIAEVPGIRASVGTGQSGQQITITLVSDNPTKLEAASVELAQQMQTIKGLTNVQSTASLLRPELLIKPDFARAAQLGVSVSQISAVAKLATQGDVDANLAKFNLADRQIPILVQLDPEARQDIETLENLRVSSMTTASTVPLKAIAEIHRSSGAAQISRSDRARQTTIRGDLNGTPLSEASQAIHSLPIMQHLPVGVTEQNQGDLRRQSELFTEFSSAMGLGVLLVFVVLVLLFSTFFQPITIMMALPLSIGGALLALLLTGKSLSLPALIGLLMLLGLVAKNSILLVESAIVSIREGKSRRDALIEAGSKRAQPILMTSIAMIAGMLPIAMGLGADTDFRSPMAVAVVGGLITSTLLSLVFIPVVFTLVDDLQIWVATIFRRIIPTNSSSETVNATYQHPSMEAD